MRLFPALLTLYCLASRCGITSRCLPKRFYQYPTEQNIYRYNHRRSKAEAQILTFLRKYDVTLRNYELSRFSLQTQRT
ncbi:uncharacterized protein EDB91DRAFT_1156244 [Suillus paluster]|uniref:uncharacterized protein n=1 Tax=Suillus paluster TaxID=48578 RepID=UPI001B85EB04|nr:uncharacterized protein EDB91DRAFT_1156244 [Suillus paluster]KAG1730845.1 hypothetical protein EDB91DRAFT_1156244 [Suillus paluster]